MGEAGVFPIHETEIFRWSVRCGMGRAFFLPGPMECGYNGLSQRGQSSQVGAVGCASPEPGGMRQPPARQVSSNTTTATGQLISSLTKTSAEPETVCTRRQRRSRDSNRKIRALEEARCLPGVGLLREAVWSGSEPSNTGARPSASGSN